MSLLDQFHAGYSAQRRVASLTRMLAELLPADVLDVGTGDGALAGRIQQCRPDARIRGIDTHPRPKLAMPIALFDGQVIPSGDRSVDTVILNDVLHHTNDPRVLLREARRVARKNILIKDHLLTGLLAGPTLRFMDWVGNEAHGVALPYNYWTRARWDHAFAELRLAPDFWQGDLRLYPFMADWAFGRSLHFIGRFALA